MAYILMTLLEMNGVSGNYAQQFLDSLFCSVMAVDNNDGTVIALGGSSEQSSSDNVNKITYSVPNEQPATRYLSDRQVADRYNISESTLARWRRHLGFPRPISLVPGGPNRTALEVLLAYEAERNVAAPLEPPPAQSFNPNHPFYPRASNAKRRQGLSRQTKQLEDA